MIIQYSIMIEIKVKKEKKKKKLVNACACEAGGDNIVASDFSILAYKSKNFNFIKISGESDGFGSKCIMTSRREREREREVLRNGANVIKLTNYENINDILTTKEKEKEKILGYFAFVENTLVNYVSIPYH